MFLVYGNRQVSNYPQDKGVVVCQVVSLLFAYHMILLDRVYWLAIYIRLLIDSNVVATSLFV